MESIEVERAVVALIDRYATALDNADWALLRSVWADKLDVDYAPVRRGLWAMGSTNSWPDSTPG